MIKRSKLVGATCRSPASDCLFWGIPYRVTQISKKASEKTNGYTGGGQDRPTEVPGVHDQRTVGRGDLRRQQCCLFGG